MMAWRTKQRLSRQKARFADMARKRAPGGGRKPLTPTEPTVKVAITLLSSQVEAMKQLGDGNLSAGIRKAIDMSAKPTNLMTVEERALYEAVSGTKLPPQTDNEINEALRLAAAEYWQSKDDDRGLLPGPKTLHNTNYMPPEEQTE